MKEDGSSVKLTNL